MADYAIWKFPIELRGLQYVEMPVGAKILYVAQQYDQVCLWAKINTNALKERRTIHVAGTGHSIPDCGMNYIGSVMMDGGAMVFHVFEVAT